MVMVLDVISEHMFKHIFKFNSNQALTSEHVLTPRCLDVQVGRAVFDSYTDSISSSHFSRVIFASFIIFLIIPFPISSPGCTVINVVLPSGWRMNKWLPFCLICEKPIFSSCFDHFFGRKGIDLIHSNCYLDLLDAYEFQWHFINKV